MASFLGILKKIGGVAVAVEPFAVPLVSALVPGAAGPLAVLHNLVVKAEETFTQPGSGAQKKTFVVEQFNALMTMIQPILKEKAGIILTFDPQVVSESVDSIVTGLNASKKLYETFDVAKVPVPGE